MEKRSIRCWLIVRRGSALQTLIKERAEGSAGGVAGLVCAALDVVCAINRFLMTNAVREGMLSKPEEEIEKEW